MAKNTKRYVLAGNWKQFDNYCQQKQIPRNAVHYIGGIQDIRGLNGIEIVKYGTWWLNPVADEVRMRAQAGAFKFVEEFTEEVK